ncbi:MAG: methyltransferase domain-containing protein [Pseudomonadota bacterium]
MAIFTPANGFGGPGGLAYDEGVLNRLNARFKAFIEPCRKEFAGARVLDLASHDGRWSLAALRVGAAHVTGIEVRAELVTRTKALFNKTDAAKVRFLKGDAFDIMPALKKADQTFDIVLCLGLFNIVSDHDRLLRQMAAFSPKLIVLDGGLANIDDCVIHLRSEGGALPPEAMAEQFAGPEAALGTASRGALELMARTYGYGVSYVDWETLALESRNCCEDYFNERRDGSRIKRFSVFLRPL